MLFASESERRVARAVADLVYANPFLPARLEAERAALGTEFDPAGTLWQARDEPAASPNERHLAIRVAALLERIRPRLAGTVAASSEDLSLYEALVLYRLYDRAQPGGKRGAPCAAPASRGRAHRPRFSTLWRGYEAIGIRRHGDVMKPRMLQGRDAS